MSGPWDDYSGTEDGPWTAFAAPKASLNAPVKPSGLEAFAAGLTQPLDTMVNAVDRATSNWPIMRSAAAFDKRNGIASPSDLTNYHRQQRANGNGAAVLAGQVVGTLPTLAIGGGTGAVARVGSTLAQGAAGGALLSDGTNAGDIGVDALKGAAGAGIVKAGFAGAGKLARPLVQRGAQELLDRGISLTPGQIIGGTAQRVEDAMTSVPLLGGMISRARGRGEETFNRQMVNEVLDPIGVKMPDSLPTGHQAIQFMKDTFTKGYNSTLGAMKVAPDQALTGEIAALHNKAATMVDGVGKQFQGFIDREVTPRFRNGVMDGEGMKTLERELRSKIARYGKSTSGADQDIAELFAGLRASLRDGARRTSGPKLSNDLDALDNAYANYVPVRDAASKSRNGVVAPGSLDTSVRVADRSAGKGNKATGTARMQGLSSNAAAVMPSRTGNSGTTDRLLANAVAFGAVPTAAAGVSPLAIAVPPLLSLAYTRGGQKAVTGLLAGNGPKRAAVQGLLRLGGRTVPVAVPPLLARRD